MTEHRILTLDNNTVTKLLSEHSIAEKFTVVKEALLEAENKASFYSKGCKPCQAKSKKSNYEMMAVKKSIINMQEDDQNKIKELLKTDKIKIIFTNPDGKTAEIVI